MTVEFNSRGHIVRNGKEFCPVHKERHYLTSKGHHRCTSCEREKRWIRDFGVDASIIYSLFNSQKFICAISTCNRTVSYQEKFMGHVDHDHNTGRIRGILCSQHNHGIGLFHDNSSDMRAAGEYVDRNKSLEFLESLTEKEALELIDLV